MDQARCTKRVHYTREDSRDIPPAWYIVHEEQQDISIQPKREPEDQEKLTRAKPKPRHRVTPGQNLQRIHATSDPTRARAPPSAAPARRPYLWRLREAQADQPGIRDGLGVEPDRASAGTRVESSHHAEAVLLGLRGTPPENTAPHTRVPSVVSCFSSCPGTRIRPRAHGPALPNTARGSRPRTEEDGEKDDQN